MNNLGNCKLCNKDSELQASHIIPKFVFRWLKNTSGTPYLRFGESPNKRAQDGIKEYILCRECETLFSKWEKEFSDNIFHPFNAGTTDTARYEEWLLKFCVSLSWRILIMYIHLGALEQLNESQKISATKASEKWKDFLLGKEAHPAEYQQHLIPLDSIESISDSIENVPTNISRYLLRAIDTDIGSSEEIVFTYAKFGKFILIGFIKCTKANEWKGSKISVKNGWIKPRIYELPRSLLDYLFYRAERSQKIFGKISPPQDKKIQQDIINNSERFIYSDTFKALSEDIRLFGNEVFYKNKE